jgi:hypothetical protein
VFSRHLLYVTPRLEGPKVPIALASAAPVCERSSLIFGLSVSTASAWAAGLGQRAGMSPDHDW